MKSYTQFLESRRTATSVTSKHLDKDVASEVRLNGGIKPGIKGYADRAAAFKAQDAKDAAKKKVTAESEDLDENFKVGQRVTSSAPGTAGHSGVVTKVGDDEHEVHFALHGKKMVPSKHLRDNSTEFKGNVYAREAEDLTEQWEVWEKGTCPKTGVKRSKDGKDYKVKHPDSPFKDRKAALKHMKNLGGEAHGVYVQPVVRSECEEVELDENMDPHYRAGMMAAYDGKTAKHNPHDKMSMEHKLWKQGHKDNYRPQPKKPIGESYIEMLKSKVKV